jgi:hypothetical protein
MTGNIYKRTFAKELKVESKQGLLEGLCSLKEGLG